MEKKILETMRADWDKRARENARHYVQDATHDWNDREFFRSGEINVANDVMGDMVRICGGTRSPLDLRMLEIGCGVGRMTRMLARIFGHVTAIDISQEMISRARDNLRGLQNVSFVLGDGCSLTGLDSEQFDFAFSFIVFQHIPSYEVIQRYCKEVFRVVKPGSLFKFQVQGDTSFDRVEHDTWLGIPISESKARDLADESGFQLELMQGAGSQIFWLWFRKPAV